MIISISQVAKQALEGNWVEPETVSPESPHSAACVTPCSVHFAPGRTQTVNATEAKANEALSARHAGAQQRAAAPAS